MKAQHPKYLLSIKESAKSRTRREVGGAASSCRTLTCERIHIICNITIDTLKHTFLLDNQKMRSISRCVKTASFSKPTSHVLSTSAKVNATPPFQPGPAPPRLPKEEQDVYEQLQKSSTGAFSTPVVEPTVVVNQSAGTPAGTQSRQRPHINQSPLSNADNISVEQKVENVNAKVTASGEGEELHPDVRRGARPEFEGERNPQTGEIGGPKNEPLRWGGGVDWSYNGRVTDF